MGPDAAGYRDAHRAEERRERELDDPVAAVDDREQADQAPRALGHGREHADVVAAPGAAHPASAPRPCRFEITPYGTRGSSRTTVICSRSPGSAP